MKPHQSHRLWFAHMLHRFSGLGLALFLPLHFLLLSQALHGEAQLQTALSWTDHWFFKIAETGLVFLLSVHLFGGIRLLVLEWVKPSSDRWTDVHKSLVAVVLTLAFAVALLFFLSVI